MRKKGRTKSPSGQEAAFATYLVRVTDELQRRHHLTFRTLSPVNEPNTKYWFAANTQEGAHWSPARTAQMIDATAAALKAKGLSTVVRPLTRPHRICSYRTGPAYPPATRAAIVQLNVHSYGTVHQTAVRDIARLGHQAVDERERHAAVGRPGGPDRDGVTAGLCRACRRRSQALEPAAWVFWQAVEDLSTRKGEKGSNWGIVKADLMVRADQPHAIHVTGKYWVDGAVQPLYPARRPAGAGGRHGYGRAMSVDGRRLVLVHVNPGLSPRPLSVAVPGRWQRRMIVRTLCISRGYHGGYRHPSRW